ncbi:MAG TPA: sulfatase-like hydrolase/transferase, partial [Polyangiaceae bacterium]
MPSLDVMILLVAFFLVRAQGWSVPKLVHGCLAGFVCVVRVLRLGDGIQDRYFAQRFSLYDLAMFPEGVRFAHSALPWWKFYAALLAAVTLLALLPLFAYHTLRTAEAYFVDWKRAPLVGVLALVAFGVGLAQPRKSHHKPLFAGGFGNSIAPRLQREARFLASVFADRGKWAEAVARADALLARTPSDLAKLERKNVHLVLVESYGVVVVERPEFVSAIRPTFRAIEEELAGLGYSIASGRLDSPTFGGRSWLAQSTLATAIPVTDQLGFDTVATVKPKVLSGYFRAAGYRTVLAAPGVTRLGTRGDLYRFDKNYYYADFEYVGPAFAWATMPDQFVFDTIRRRELARASGPLFVQYVLVSSHAPWSETPTLVDDWSKLGNGAVFDTQPVVRYPIVWPNFGRAHEAYVRSIVYDFEVIRRYVTRFLNDDSLVIVLGDHQPVVEISGDERVKTVPVHVFSKNDAFVEPFRRRGY